MPIQHIAIAGYQNRTVATLVIDGLPHFLGRELGLSRLQRRRIDFGIGLVRHTTSIQEIHQGPTMLSLDLWHLGARDIQRSGFVAKARPARLRWRRRLGGDFGRG